MNSMLMMMALRGGVMDGEKVRAMVREANEKRRKMFAKLADLLLGVVMFFWGDLKVNYTNSAGQVIDLTDPVAAKDVPLADKVAGILAAQKATNKGQLIREILRPLIIDAAELLAALMEPDEMTLGLLSQNGGLLGGSGTTVHVNTAPAIGTPGSASTATVASSFEGQFLQANDGSPQVYKIEGGQKRWVTSEDVMKRMGGQLINGRWNNTQYVSGSILAQFPTGNPIT